MDSIQSLELVEFYYGEIQKLILSGRNKINILHIGDTTGYSLTMFLSLIIGWKWNNVKCVGSRNEIIKFIDDTFTIQIIDVSIITDIITDGYNVWLSYGFDKYKIPRGQGIDCSWTFSDNLISNL